MKVKKKEGQEMGKKREWWNRVSYFFVSTAALIRQPFPSFIIL